MNSVVYFVLIGRAVKIGVTADLSRRLDEFRGSSAEDISVLAVLPGNSTLERRLHRLFKSHRITREFFRYDLPLRHFLHLVESASAEAALEWAEDRERALVALRNRPPGEARSISDRNYQAVLAERFRRRVEREKCPTARRSVPPKK